MPDDQGCSLGAWQVINDHHLIDIEDGGRACNLAGHPGGLLCRLRVVYDGCSDGNRQGGLLRAALLLLPICPARQSADGLSGVLLSSLV